MKTDLHLYQNILTEERLMKFYIKSTITIFIFIVASIIAFYAFQNLLKVINPNNKNVSKRTKSFGELTIWQQYRALKKLEKTTEEVSPEPLSIITDSTVIKVQRQDPKVQELSSQARKLFTAMIQHKQLDRVDILAIRNMLRLNTSLINKNWKNDAHEICSRLKHHSLEEKAVYSVINYLDSLIPIEEEA